MGLWQVGDTPKPLVAIFLLFPEPGIGKRTENSHIPCMQQPPRPRLGLLILTSPSTQTEKEPVVTLVSMVRLQERGRFFRLVWVLGSVPTPPPRRPLGVPAWKVRAGIWFLRSEDRRVALPVLVTRQQLALSILFFQTATLSVVREQLGTVGGESSA